MAEVTFESVVTKELGERLAKHQQVQSELTEQAAKVQQDYRTWYNEVMASPEYKRLDEATSKVMDRISALFNLELEGQLKAVKQQYEEEWKAASDKFDALYERDERRAVAFALDAVEGMEDAYVRARLGLAEIIIDFYIELNELRTEQLRWLKKFCRNPERAMRKAEDRVKRFVKQAERNYDELQDALAIAAYGRDTDIVEFAEALRKFLDKFVG